MLLWLLHGACSKSRSPYVETGNNLHVTVVRLQLNYSLKILAHFRSKVLVDFLHYVTRINCLTGATISETHTTNKYIYTNQYDPPQYLLFKTNQIRFQLRALEISLVLLR